MLTIHGHGGHGRVVADAFRSPVRFTDDADGTRPKPDDWYITAIGDNRVRKEVGGTAVVFHGTAVVAKKVKIGLGTYVGAQASIGPGARIGKCCIINTGAIVEHDCLIGDYCHVACGAVLSGGVEIGEGCTIGAGAVVRPGVKIAPWTTIGCGAAVVKDITEQGVYVGVPARPLEEARGT